MRGGGELRGFSQLYTEAQINLWDLTPYLTYARQRIGESVQQARGGHVQQAGADVQRTGSVVKEQERPDSDQERLYSVQRAEDRCWTKKRRGWTSSRRGRKSRVGEVVQQHRMGWWARIGDCTASRRRYTAEVGNARHGANEAVQRARMRHNGEVSQDKRSGTRSGLRTKQGWQSTKQKAISFKPTVPVAILEACQALTFTIKVYFQFLHWRWAENLWQFLR